MKILQNRYHFFLHILIWKTGGWIIPFTITGSLA
uniref:Uncharacterized protein n=1 Tax=Octopus bimaculoides TaxID=37653 RepID=A0A0L8G2Q4_OCTBM